MTFHNKQKILQSIVLNKNLNLVDDKINFCSFLGGKIIPGLKNIAYVNDLRSKQFKMMGDTNSANRYLKFDRDRFKQLDSFITLNDLFAKEIMKWYGVKKPYFTFPKYPYRMKWDININPRNEIVFWDNASSYFQLELYEKILQFFDDIQDQIGIKTVFISRNFHTETINVFRHKGFRSKIIPISQYDYHSKYGILVNLHNFQQAAECLPKKMLRYLHCNIQPIIHNSFTGAIDYCNKNNINPVLYTDIKDLKVNLNKNLKLWNRENFCIENRIIELINYLNKENH